MLPLITRRLLVYLSLGVGCVASGETFAVLFRTSSRGCDEIADGYI
jgi:hypothetical protein